MVLFCEECGERHVLADDEARRVGGTSFPCRKCLEPVAAPVFQERRPAETVGPRTEPGSN